MVPIEALVEVTDICDPDPVFVLTSIESDEPGEGEGDGDFPDDIQEHELGAPDVEFLLRAERSGQGDGRVYTILYTAMDASGNTTENYSEVLVPHDRRGRALAAHGFSADGTQFIPGVERFVLVIPSRPASSEMEAFDATGVRPRDAYVGNAAGAVRPLESAQGDVNGDGLRD